jgi:hypothetical protein
MEADKKDKFEKAKAYKERFVRWQQLSISQLSFSNNLLLGLNLGFLAFFTSEAGLKLNPICVAALLQIICLLGTGASFVTGIILVLNRLNDFHSTSQLIRKKQQKYEADYSLGTNNSSFEEDVKTLKSKTDKYGKRTWTLFRWQIWTFAAGTCSGIIYLLVINITCG